MRRLTKMRRSRKSRGSQRIDVLPAETITTPELSAISIESTVIPVRIGPLILPR